MVNPRRTLTRQKNNAIISTHNFEREIYLYMKVKIIGGVAAMSMALATFVSFGITASATIYPASTLQEKTTLVGGLDYIKQDGGTTAGIYKSLLELTYNNENGSLLYHNYKTEDGKKELVYKKDRYVYWTVSKKESKDFSWPLTRTDYKFTMIPRDPSYSKRPTAINSLTYNGNSQTLISKGTAASGTGTVQYGLNKNNMSATPLPSATDAGTYIVYYKIAGNKNNKYNDLDPASVTVKINKANSSYTTEPATKELTYTGEAQALVSAGAATGGTVQYKLDDGEWSTAVPTATSVGSYTVSYKVVGDANHNDIAENSVSVTISKADASFTTAPVAQSLTWTGEAQALVTAGTAKFGTVQYKLGDGSYSTAVPTATAVGSYTVYYKVVGDANHNDVDESSVKVTISKADASFTTAPAAQSLTWTGEAQALVTAGTANGGEIQYSLDNSNWSTDIPTATAVDTYTVYYKIAGDADHNDTAVKSVTVTIGAKDAEATYKNVNNIVGDEYDGEASAWTVTVTPGSTAITSVDVKVNDIGSDGAWDSNTAISGGPINFGVVVKAAADKVKSMTAVVNSIDVPATLDTTPID